MLIILALYHSVCHGYRALQGERLKAEPIRLRGKLTKGVGRTLSLSLRQSYASQVELGKDQLVLRFCTRSRLQGLLVQVLRGFEVSRVEP